MIHNWEFVFLAANQDAIMSGGSVGINRESSCTYDYSRWDDECAKDPIFGGHPDVIRAIPRISFSPMKTEPLTVPLIMYM